MRNRQDGKGGGGGGGGSCRRAGEEGWGFPSGDEMGGKIQVRVEGEGEGVGA